MKIAPVLEEKEKRGVEVVNAEVVSGRMNTAGFEGALRFKFEDGAEFTVVNKLIVNYSKYGKGFFQTPITFLDVTVKGRTGLPPRRVSHKAILTTFTAH